jgi:hypothetical protein
MGYDESIAGDFASTSTTGSLTGFVSVESTFDDFAGNVYAPDGYRSIGSYIADTAFVGVTDLTIDYSSSFPFTHTGTSWNGATGVTWVEGSYIVGGGGNIDWTAAAGGDPYVRSANGKVTKLPNQHGFYRMFQHGDIIINSEQDECDITERMKAYLKTVPGFNPAYIKNVITKGFFNKKIFISSEGNVIELDLFKHKVSESKNNTAYFSVSQIRNKVSDMEGRDVYGSKKIPVSFDISWNHSVYGKQQIVADIYSNPQSMNGISMKSRLLSHDATTGIFAKNYKAALMAINKLSDIDTKTITKRLKKAEKSGKSTLHTKPIDKNETWYKVKESGMELNRRI